MNPITMYLKNRKAKKVKRILEFDIPIILPSGKNFIETYKHHIKLVSAKFDLDKILEQKPEERFQFLIENFNEIATLALVETLVEVGFKESK